MGYLTLRIYNAACELPSRWTTEDLTAQRNRVLVQLAAASPMNAATFSCCYPLFKRILNTEGITDAQRLSLLKVFEAHADLRSDLETVRETINTPLTVLIKYALSIMQCNNATQSLYNAIMQ